MPEEAPKKKSFFIPFLLNVTGIVAFMALAVCIMFLLHLKEDMVHLSKVQEAQQKKHTETNQFLLSTIDWSTNRQKKILFMRDMVVEEWKRCGFDISMEKAYSIAETDFEESEKYPYLDPFLFLAMQWKESSFIDTVVSNMGALGLNQIMPATGRLLCGFFNIEYSESILYDAEASTKLAAKLFDVLYSQYQNFELVLADYNGGPWSAYYYRTQDARLAEETADYVPKVMQKYEEYKERYKTYMVDQTLITSKK